MPSWADAQSAAKSAAQSAAAAGVEAAADETQARGAEAVALQRA